MKLIIFIILFVAALGLSLVLFRSEKQKAAKLETAQTRIAELENYIVQQRKQIDSLAAFEAEEDSLELVPPGGVAFVDELGSLSEADIKRLKKRGLQNPEAQLQTDLLRKQRSLLPVKGSMGGTMQIRDTRVLNEKYVLAYFEDGHTGGYMILRYEVDNGSITWKVIDSYSI